MGPERIVAAACIFNGLAFHMPMPARHGQILRAFNEIGHIRMSPNQGFITSTGRYVNRYEAKVIAVAAGQVNKTEHDELYSEDLW